MRCVTVQLDGRDHRFFTEMTAEQVQDAFDSLLGHVNVVVGAANTIAGKLLVDLDEYLRGHRTVYRHTVKHRLRMAIREFEAYERLHYSGFGEKYALFLDYLNEAEDEMMPDIQKMYFSFKQVLDKAKEPQSELFAKIEVALDMIRICCKMYDYFIDDCRQRTGLNFDHFLRPARLDGSLYWMCELEKIVCRTGGKDISLAADDNCRLGVGVILRKLGNEEMFLRLCNRALEYHPEQREQLSEEDKAMLAAAGM